MSILTTNFPNIEDVERYDTERLINFLRLKILNLDEKNFKILRDQDVDGLAFLHMTEDVFIKPPFNFSYGKAKKLGMLIDSLNNQRLLTLEEALLCIPPPAFIKKLTKSIPNLGDHVPDDVFLWDDFLESVRMYEFTDKKRYQRPQFSHSKMGVGETSIQAIFEFNICEVLNELLPNYLFSRKSTKNPGDPDFTCFFAQSTLLFPIEIKPEYLLEIGKLQFPEYYKKRAEARTMIKQIFSYMIENECQYGIFSTYNMHWFLYRPSNNPKKLWISETLELTSEFPTVLKAYAYMVQKLCCDSDKSYYSPHILKILDSVTRKDEELVSNTRSLRSRTKSSFNNSLGSLSFNILYKSQMNNQNFSFLDFKFNDILGQGRSGKTLKCEFRGNTIALKCTDLWKYPLDILKEMQNEVEIYQILASIQEEFIPKLMCYGYYGGGICYIIGTSFSGTALTDYKHITERQRVMCLCAINAIHSKGVLHNDIRAENILLSNINDNVYWIDFGMASYHCEVKKCWKLFDEEKRELVNLLNQYTLLDSVVIV
ncbi:kinase-like protein [Rhizophagus irregularis]|uniref:Kinase-like protein n=1 Tax=Rhizophagus irregularis TaxID=588596 RepID=A0A2N0RL60_9GLOM|nr:kinase-like protein [Rhizophagus irregularis]